MPRFERNTLFGAKSRCRILQSRLVKLVVRMSGHCAAETFTRNVLPAFFRSFPFFLSSVSETSPSLICRSTFGRPRPAVVYINVKLAFCILHNLSTGDPGGHLRPTEKKKQKKHASINKHTQKDNPPLPKSRCPPKESKWIIYLCSPSRDDRSSIGTKVCFHTKFNQFVSTGSPRPFLSSSSSCLFLSLRRFPLYFVP